MIPAPLDQKNFKRWDAGLYLPLYRRALDFWKIALRQLKPFYRVTDPAVARATARVPGAERAGGPAQFEVS